MARTLDDPTRQPLRLTRRGRVVVTLTALALIGVGFSLAHVSSQAADRQPTRVRHTIVVHAGETLWEVAERVAPHVDPRLVVTALERENHLRGPLVEPGQQLVVPVAR